MLLLWYLQCIYVYVLVGKQHRKNSTGKTSVLKQHTITGSFFIACNIFTYMTTTVSRRWGPHMRSNEKLTYTIFISVISTQRGEYMSSKEFTPNRDNGICYVCQRRRRQVGVVCDMALEISFIIDIINNAFCVHLSL